MTLVEQIAQLLNDTYDAVPNGYQTDAEVAEKILVVIDLDRLNK